MFTRNHITEPVNATQAVVFNGTINYPTFSLKFKTGEQVRYQGLHLASRGPHLQPALLKAARTLYQRLRKSGTIDGHLGTDFCHLSGCNAGVYYHVLALRAKGFRVSVR